MFPPAPTAPPSPAATIEVDGTLNLVGAYDLHRRLDALIGSGVRHVGLDLSRVATMDDDGVRGVMRSRDTAIAAQVTLRLTSCSRPSLAAMHSFEARHARRRQLA